MARDSIKLWRSYIDAARYLPDAERLAYYDALFAYGIYDEEPQLDGVTAAMFALTKPNLDKSIAKASAGQKGGNISKPQANGKQTESKTEADCKQSGSKTEANGKQNGSNPQAIREERIENREERIENIYIDSDESICQTAVQSDIHEAVKLWNGLGLGQVTKLTAGSERYKLLGARLKQYGLDGWKKALDEIRQSAWLRGNGSKGWVITFDWLVKPNNFPKVHDGNYRDREASKPWQPDYGTDEGYIGL